MKNFFYSSFLLSFFFLLFYPTVIKAEVIERRRLQLGDASVSSGYAFFPIFFNLPGAGKAYGFLGYLNNIYESPVSAYGTVITGDFNGHVLGITNIPIYKKYLRMDPFNVHFTKSSLKTYNQRGMDSDRNDYNIINADYLDILGIRLTASFWERRFEIYSVFYKNQFSIDSIADKNGKKTASYSNRKKRTANTNQSGVSFDFTDDKSDPRKGLAVDFSPKAQEKRNPTDANYTVLDINLTGYIPVLSYSTVALNYYHSQVVMQKKGELDRQKLIDQYGLNCSALKDQVAKNACERDVEKIIQAQIAENKYGTAGSLGGISRLRSFDEGRFKGSIVEFVGAELRWNLSQDPVPFNIFLAKDVRTELQLAFFYERGSVADSNVDLWKKSAFSYGTGIRIITASGFIYRFDVANGNEGKNFTFFIDYPWGNFRG